jgi:hypothetical protein
MPRTVRGRLESKDSQVTTEARDGLLSVILDRGLRPTIALALTHAIDPKEVEQAEGVSAYVCMLIADDKNIASLPVCAPSMLRMLASGVALKFARS